MQSKAVSEWISRLDWILLVKYPFFHNIMCSLQCLLFKISKSTAAAGSSVLLCLKSSFGNRISHDIWPDINTSKSDGSVAILPFVYT